MNRTVQKCIRHQVWGILVVLLCFLQPIRSVRIDPSVAQERKQARDLRNSPQPIPNVPVDVPTNPEDHLVTSLPLWQNSDGGSSFPVKHWAGHLPASADGDKYFFYWLFAPDSSNAEATQLDNAVLDKDIPLLIWLNGGPGCSSMDGLFIENGPLRFVKSGDDYILTDNPYSWNKAPAYTLYIDQPVGTGLSFTTSQKYPTNDLEVNIDFYYFLTQFIQLHADKFLDSPDGAARPTTNRPIFFSGESHAGHYIPSMMNYILQQNNNNSSIKVLLQGAAIGNGWMDPFHQYAAAEAAYGHGLLDRPQVNAMDALERECQEKLAKGHFVVSECYALLDKVVAQSYGSNSEYKVSTYDARLAERKGAAREFPFGHRLVETYLGNWPEKQGSLRDWDSSSTNVMVLEAIHATAAAAAGQRFQECTDPPYEALSHLDGKGVVPDVVAILEHPDNVRLLFFNGMEDLICNHVGNELFLMNMAWSGQNDWVEAPRYVWRATSEDDSKISGFMKESKNLQFLKLLDSGHMVPLDIPQPSLEMMHLFMFDKGFDQSIQNIRSQKKVDSCPVCPSAVCEICGSCPTLEPGSSGSSSQSTGYSQVTSPSIKVPWIVAGMTTLAMIIVLLRSKRQPQQHLELVSDFDLELREGSYSDQQDKTGRRII